jgi:putative DNA methylase
MDPERAKAVTAYLAMSFGRLVNSFTKFCRWQSRDQITIAAIGDRQALKMTYDYSEINPFADTAGCLPLALRNEVESIRKLAGSGPPVTAIRGSADRLPFDDQSMDAIITDPPYYHSIFYADLSAFFYVWHRRILGGVFPEHFALRTPPKRKEAVAQASEHDGSEAKAKEFYEALMASAFKEAHRVLKPNAPLICVYAHKTTSGWTTLINALVRSGMTVTEAWPVQTEARGRVNALAAAALSDSIFFVARRREVDRIGEYESQVRPELERIVRERVTTLWNDGKGLGGADLLMAAVGAGLRAYTQFHRVEYANGEEVSAKAYLEEVEGVVTDTILEEVFGMSKTGVSSVDPLTRFYILWRFTFRESTIDAGEAIVFAYPQLPQGVELDDLTRGSTALVEKKGKTYRVRNFSDRGENEDLGIPNDGRAVPLVDVLHRTLWLMENRPALLAHFLGRARPNTDQLRHVAQAVSGPVLMGADLSREKLTSELSALTRLTANWSSLTATTGATPATAAPAAQKLIPFGE